MDHRSIDTGAIHAQEAAIHPMFESTGILAFCYKKRGNIMRTKLNITEGIFPMPVLMIATYNEDGSVNVMNAAWGTMQARNMVALNLDEDHKPVENMKARKAFTVSIADAAHVTEADHFGVVSGNKVADKLAVSGLTAVKAENVDAPSSASSLSAWNANSWSTRTTSTAAGSSAKSYASQQTNAS